jgi:hypothetical protein
VFGDAALDVALLDLYPAFTAQAVAAAGGIDMDAGFDGCPDEVLAGWDFDCGVSGQKCDPKSAHYNSFVAENGSIFLNLAQVLSFRDKAGTCQPRIAKSLQLTDLDMEL